MAAIDFPSSPINDQVFGMYKYNATIGVWLVNASAITTLGTITTGVWNGSTLDIAYGGTGATTVAGARTNLGLAGLTGNQTFAGLQTFTSASTSTTPVVIKALSGQAADLLQITDNLNNIVAKFTNGGDFAEYNRVSVGSLTPIASTWLSVQPRFSGEVGQVIRGASGQTGNLQEWRNNADTILSRVDASGNIYAPSFTGNLVGSTTSVVATVPGTTSAELVRGNMADNDNFRILVGGTASNAGYAEIATADDGTEPIYVRQYSGTFTTLTRSASLLDASGNTSFPGVVTANGFMTNAGTTTVAPIDMVAGSMLTTPTAGAIEYDGVAFYATPSANFGRSVISTPIFTSGVGTSGIAATTDYPLFPAANDSISLSVGTYRIEASFQVVVATATVGSTLRFNLRGAGTAVGSTTWTGTGTIVSAGTPTQYFHSGVALGTTFIVAPTSAVAGRVYTVYGTGILRVTTAGTIIPSYQWDAALTSGVVTLYSANYLTIQPITSSSTAASTGAWA